MEDFLVTVLRCMLIQSLTENQGWESGVFAAKLWKFAIFGNGFAANILFGLFVSIFENLAEFTCGNTFRNLNT